jgi:ASC-1-like (ASCH) protein
MHEIHCQEPWFSKIRSGIKKVEGRKYSAKYSALQSGEILKFYCNQESFLAEVVKVIRYSNLEKYLTAEGITNVLPGVKSYSEALEIYLGFNTNEKIQQAGGFLAIHLKIIPACDNPSV